MTHTSPNFYAVRVGRAPGIYLTWEECKAQVDHYSGCVFKKFKTLAEAQNFVGRGSTGTGTNPQMMGWVGGFGHYPTSNEV
ncbi:hypothetical protein JCM3765_004477 [Sporobolomyces pararoseus]